MRKVGVAGKETLEAIVNIRGLAIAKDEKGGRLIPGNGNMLLYDASSYKNLRKSDRISFDSDVRRVGAILRKSKFQTYRPRGSKGGMKNVSPSRTDEHLRICPTTGVILGGALRAVDAVSGRRTWGVSSTRPSTPWRQSLRRETFARCI